MHLRPCAYALIFAASICSEACCHANFFGFNDRIPGRRSTKEDRPSPAVISRDVRVDCLAAGTPLSIDSRGAASIDLAIAGMLCQDVDLPKAQSPGPGHESTQLPPDQPPMSQTQQHPPGPTQSRLVDLPIISDAAVTELRIRLFDEREAIADPLLADVAETLDGNRRTAFRAGRIINVPAAFFGRELRLVLEISTAHDVSDLSFPLTIIP